MSDFDRDESGWRRGINNAACTASRRVGAIDRSGSDPTVHGQRVDANLLGELPLVEPAVPELTNELIDLGLIATPARALDVMHPSLSPGLHRIGNHGVHRTLTFIGHPDAGWRSAVIYSLLITARRYRLDPAAWLSDVLRRIPTCTQANLPELLPWNWKPKAA